MFKWTIFEIEQKSSILNSNGTAVINKVWNIVHTEPYDSTDDESIEAAFNKCLEWLKTAKKESKYVIQELYHHA